MTAQSLDTFFKTKMKELSIPGASSAIVSSDKVIWQATYGHLNCKESTPVNENTLFCLQSTTKTITAVAALLACQDGLFTLDTPIYTLIPSISFKSREPDLFKKITIRHLLTHTSGLLGEGRIGGVFNCEKGSFAEHVESCFGTYLHSEPGNRFNYSNIGMDLVTYIIEKVSSIPYETFISRKLAQPLGIKIYFDVEEIYATGNAAQGSYSGFLATKVDGLAYGCGGAFLSLKDQARYAQFLLNKGEGIIQEELFNEMLKVDGEVGYGLGVFKSVFGNLELYNHAGGGFGLISELFWSYKENIAIFCLANNEDAAFEFKTAVIDLLKHYLESVGKKVKEVGIEVGNAKDYDNLHILGGSYIGDWGQWNVTIEQNKLYLNGVEYQSHENWIFSTDTRVIRFDVDGETVKAIYTHHPGIGLLKFEKMNLIEISYQFDTDWQKYAGLYQFDLYCSDTLYQAVYIQDNKLFLNNNGPTELMHLEESIFVTSTGETVVFEDELMYNTSNTKCLKKENIVSELTELKKRDPNHRHLTFWMLDVCAANLRMLGREEDAKAIEALKPIEAD
ncbi:MAG: beta-lactamase family protein [Candidatus Heimdallarchaeota archaeon]|nr:beta-lactamase family protein [Candidatus Heimdallarchaeota archaeon]